jgi:hypothetical protein
MTHLLPMPFPPVGLLLPAGGLQRQDGLARVQSKHFTEEAAALDPLKLVRRLVLEAPTRPSLEARRRLLRQVAPRVSRSRRKVRLHIVASA